MPDETNLAAWETTTYYSRSSKAQLVTSLIVCKEKRRTETSLLRRTRAWFYILSKLWFSRDLALQRIQFHFTVFCFHVSI